MSSPTKPLEILHIEDSVDDAFFFRHQLSSVDIEIGRVVHVQDLASALLKIGEGLIPDLVFLDISLPDAWDVDGLKTLLEKAPYLIVVVLTGSGDDSLPLRALESGAQDYVSKQELSAEMLARVIRFALFRAETQEALHSAIEEAKRANLAKSRFLANISHELRTPLNIMMGFTDLFATEVEGFPAEERQQALSDLRTVSEAQSHLLDLLNDLIDMAKIESDQFRLEPCVFSLHQLVENVTHLFRDALSDKDNQFSCQLHGDLPELIFADPRRIRQLLINLLSNANKFTTGGRIELLVECRPAIHPDDDGYDLCLQVSDTGIGISEEDQHRIFEYFQQVDDSTQRPFDGSGIGLTICRQLASMMGGDISVESDLGNGSTFTVNLKVASAELRALEFTDDLGEPASFPGNLLQDCQALVIEDEQNARRFVAHTLESMGVDVTQVSSAEEAALVLVGEQNFDVIIVDIHLPGKNGLDLVRAIRRSQKTARAPRVIVATGDRSEIVRERCEEEGVESILIKPFAAEALFERVLKGVS